MKGAAAESSHATGSDDKRKCANLESSIQTSGSQLKETCFAVIYTARAPGKASTLRLLQPVL